MNITRWLCISLVALSFGCSSLQTGRPVSIFNGKNLKGWEGNEKLWSAKDGMIVGQTTPENSIRTNTFLVWRAGTVDDFEISFKYKITAGNSGLQYRSTEMTNIGKWVVGGYQADIDAGNRYTGIMYEERGPRAIAAQRGQKVTLKEGGKKEVTGAVGTDAEIKAVIKNDDWNEYVVTARGHHFVHQINGKTTVDVTDEDVKNRKDSGILAFQLHTGPPMKMEIKDVKLTRFPVEAKKK